MLTRCLIVALLLSLLFSGARCFAQRSTSVKPPSKSTTIGSRKQARLLDPAIDVSSYPHHSVGIKIGDPIAFSYKFYANERVSFVIDIGRAGRGLYDKYYREKFSDYTSIDTFANAASSLKYLTHHATRDVVGEVKFLYHVFKSDVPVGMQPYLGVGWQWKNTSLSYTYLYNSPAVENRPGTFHRRRLTMGPQILAGIEYWYQKVPVAVFLELEFFRDIQADPGWHRFEGGLGLRYIFK